ncbi:MAG: ATP-dependent DNA helicase [Gammaproteobacteria bacterium]
MLTPEEILSGDGPLARRIDGFSVRTQQQEMAAVISEALNGHRSLICEAGTGTGKTFAYLVPVLVSGKKVIISTGTKHLQDQLFHKDLPVVREALNTPLIAVLLKGRANYLCLHRLKLIETEGRVSSKKLLSDVTKIRKWSNTTQSGDLNELTFLPEDSAARPLASSTAENCLGQQCDYFDDCYVFKARKQAKEADLVIVNHHLFLADMTLREQGFGEVLPAVDSIIFDEAHQIPELASIYFSQNQSSRQLLELLQDVKTAYFEEAADMPGLLPLLDKTEKTIRDLRLAFGLADRRITWTDVKDEETIKSTLSLLLDTLQQLLDCLLAVSERGRLLENCWRRCNVQYDFIEDYAESDSEDYVQWVETRGKSFVLNRTPVDIAETFQSRLAGYDANTIFTSATLAVDHDFSHFASQLGLDKIGTHVLESPFDYQQQALLYLPKTLPDPRAPGFIESFIQTAVPILKLSKGRAFLLFTSHNALKSAAEMIGDLIDFPVFVQGQAPRSELLSSFRETQHAVLLGTSSFWEGVDVKGQALSCVIIEKLPFASPGDPVLQARINYMNRQGRNPFMEYQLPQAVIGLKQGVGRLIRDINDYGVLTICDSRISTKSYGKRFIDSLPPMPITHSLDDVAAFFASKEK